MEERDTIVALASGALPSAIAVVRISGSESVALLTAFVKDAPEPRSLAFRKIVNPESGELIDEGMAVFMPGPNSFTGEDCVEFNLHGSIAVVEKFLAEVTRFEGVRLATAGEFSRRAFEAGKLDLTQVEGLADLISAETENQRIQSLGRLEGRLGQKLSLWRSQLISLMAEIEAQLDFSDEGDVNKLVWTKFFEELELLLDEIKNALSGYGRGRIVREGFRVGLGGPPNVGKSSILNRLANSDVAIVTAEAGTTRDVREVPINIGGQLILLYDSAGLRDTLDAAEAEGVRRATKMLESSDLILWVTSVDTNSDVAPPRGYTTEVLHLCNKSDLGLVERCALSVSCKTGSGFDELIRVLGEKALTRSGSEGVLISHIRDKECLSEAIEVLEKALALLRADSGEQNLELVAECLRQATQQMQRLLGLVDSENVLDELFSGFCIGK